MLRYLIIFIFSFNTFGFQISKNKIIDGAIWGIDFLSPQEIILTQREGKIFKYHLEKKILQEINHKMTVHNNGQGGLLDVMIDKKEIYLTYSKKIDSNKYTTALYKGTIVGKELIGTDIFIASATSHKSIHFGSRVIKKDNSLYLTIGDRGLRDKAQELSSHHGKVLRLTIDGKPHPNNPFKSSPYIYSYGHRNPQGLIAAGKILYAAEFGPRGGDEVNIIQEGLNYGWPIITYGSEYWGPKIGTTHKKGMQQPLVHWTPSISPSGIAHYSHNRFSNWKGNIFLAALGSEHLRRVVLKKGKVIKQEELLKDLGLRLRVVKQSPNGEIIIGSDNGQLIRIF